MARMDAGAYVNWCQANGLVEIEEPPVQQQQPAQPAQPQERPRVGIMRAPQQNRVVYVQEDDEVRPPEQIRARRVVRPANDEAEPREELPQDTPWWVLWLVRVCTYVHDCIVAFWHMSWRGRIAAMFKVCSIMLSVLALMLFCKAIWTSQSVVTHWIGTIFTEVETEGLEGINAWIRLQAKNINVETRLGETDTRWNYLKRWWEKTFGHGFGFVQTLVTNFMSLTWVSMAAVQQFHQLRARRGQ